MPTELNSNVVELSPASLPERAPQVATVGGRVTPPVGGAALPPRGEQEAPVPETALAEAISNLNDHVQSVRRELQFSVDDNTGRKIIKVMDTDTQEVIRQIPPEEVLTLAEHLDDLQGLLLKAQV